MVVKMLSSFKYCVVVPHRNIPDLLRRCLKSIPRLPYVYVLVIDNSGVGYLDKEITGLHFGFGGITFLKRNPLNIGYIRNEALKYLREQHFNGYLVFADADDYFTPEAADCFESFKDSEYDLIWFAVNGVNEEGNESNNADFINHHISLYNNNDQLGALRYNSGPVWGKFISFGLIVQHDVWFREIETCEDTLFSAKLGYYSQNPYVCSIPLYVYVQRQGSIVMSVDAHKAQLGFYSAYETTCWLKEKTTDGYYWTQYNVIWHWMNWCQKDGSAWREFLKVLKLCEKKSTLKGAMKMISRNAKAIILGNRTYKIDNNN